MKRLIFAFIAILVFTAGSVDAQGPSLTTHFGPFTHTINSNGGGSLCISAAEQELCYTEDQYGNSGVAVKTVIPVSPGVAVTGEFSYSEGGNFNGCLGGRVGVPKYNVGVSDCIGRQSNTTHIYSRAYGNAGRFGVGYESDHLELRPRDPNEPRIPESPYPWGRPKY